MARFTISFPAGTAVTCGSSAVKHVAGVTSLAGRPLWLESVSIKTRRNTAADPLMQVRLVEYTTDGTTGTTNTVKSDDPDVTASKPTSKRSYTTGALTDVPNGGGAPVIFEDEVAPQYEYQRQFVSADGTLTHRLEPSRTFSLEVNPGTQAQDVVVTMVVRD